MAQYVESYQRFSGDPYAYALTVDSTPALIVPARPRHHLIFINPGDPTAGGGGSAVLTGGGGPITGGGGPLTGGGTGGGGAGSPIYICPALDVNGDPLIPAIFGAGCLPILAGTWVAVNFLNTQAWWAISTTDGSPFTVWEFL